MKNTRYATEFSSLAALGTTLAAILLLAACGPATEPGQTSSSEAGTETPPLTVEVTPVEPPADKPEPVEVATAKPAPSSPAGNVNAELQSKLQACESMVDWYLLHKDYEEGAAKTPEAEAAFAKKEQELLATAKPYTINDSLELVDFKWESAATETEQTEPTKFTASWLFRKTGKIEFEPNHAVSLILRGQPDKAHVDRLTDKTHRAKGFFDFNWRLVPSIDTWEEGEYHLYTRNTFKPIPNVPYRIRTHFAEIAKNEEGEWRFVQPYGKPISLRGWYAAIAE